MHRYLQTRQHTNKTAQAVTPTRVRQSATSALGLRAGHRHSITSPPPHTDTHTHPYLLADIMDPQPRPVHEMHQIQQQTHIYTHNKQTQTQTHKSEITT